MDKVIVNAGGNAENAGSAAVTGMAGVLTQPVRRESGKEQDSKLLKRSVARAVEWLNSNGFAAIAVRDEERAGARIDVLHERDPLDRAVRDFVATVKGKGNPDAFEHVGVITLYEGSPLCGVHAGDMAGRGNGRCIGLMNAVARKLNKDCGLPVAYYGRNVSGPIYELKAPSA